MGKSSLINCLQPERQMETGAISRKIERGRHTTRHSEIIPIKEQTYIMDTPGFSTLDIPGLERKICGGIIRNLRSMSQTAVLRAAVISGSRPAG